MTLRSTSDNETHTVNRVHRIARRTVSRSARNVAAVAIATLSALSLVPAEASADAVYGNYLVGGRIEQEYLARGGPSVVGNPTNTEANDSRGGKFQIFQNNASIYWNANVAGGYAKLIGGAIRDLWGLSGYETGLLGYPITSETSLSKQNGRYNQFQGGSIYYTSATGAHAVMGAIRDIWAQGGNENSSYGYPIGDEYPLNGGYQQEFQNGVISWNVGPDPDGDPNGTNAVVGADDPFNRFARRAAGPIKVSGGCSTPDAAGSVLCFGIGRAAPTPSPAPTINQRAAPQPSTPMQPSETPTSPPSAAPSSAPTVSTMSPAPDTSTPQPLPPCPTTTSTTTPTTTDTTTPVAPACVSAAPLAPTATTTSPPATTTAPGVSGQSLPQNRPFPAAGPLRSQQAPTEVTVPGDPPRNTAAERAFYKESLCAGAALANYFGKRFYLCGTMRYSIDNYVLYEGRRVLVGSEKGFFYLDGQADKGAKSQAITYRMSAVKGAAAGDTAGNSFELKMGVGGSASRTGVAVPSNAPQVLFATGGQSVTYTITTRLEAPPATGYVQRLESDTLQGTVSAKNPLYKESPTAVLLAQDLALPAARCDNFQYIYVNNPGCVMAPNDTRRNLPVLDLTTTRNLPTPVEATQLWDHVLTAQNSGVPGSPVELAVVTGAGQPIQRIPSASQSGPSGSQARANRRTACQSLRRASRYNPGDGFAGVPKWSCDEYPFSSTVQGARLYPDGGRTRDWCFIKDLPINIQIPNKFGWSACIIPDNMNVAGGSLIPSFNRENRILLNADDPTDGYFVSPYH